MPTLLDNKEEIKFIKPFLKGMENIRVLDIGCGDGLLLSNLHNKLNDKISQMIGIDNVRDNEGYLVRQNSTVGNRYMPDGKIELLKQDGFNFIRVTETQHDLIIISNVLHFYEWEQGREVLKITLTKLSARGLIYIKVANEDHSYKNENDKHPFTMTEIDEFRTFSEVLAFKKTGSHYELILKPTKN